MRPITNFALFTKNGLPLDGSVTVYESGTETLATITDSEGTTLSNPYLIANGLPSTQLFVGDVDVDVVAKDELGAEVITYKDMANATIEGVTTTSIVGVSTVADMRTAIATVGSVVCLLGYNTAGDKPIIVYQLVDDSTLVDDGGFTLASGVQDCYWVHKRADLVDVRHYGVFPPNTTPLPNISGFRWYFPYVDGSHHSYHIDGKTLNGAVIDNGVILEADESRAYLNDCTIDGVVCNGYITIEDDVVNTSHVTSSDVVLVPRREVMVDSDYDGDALNLSDVNVNFTASQTEATQTWNFTRCTFSGIGFLSDAGVWNFTECTIPQSILDDNYDLTNVTFTDCTINRADYTDGDIYFDVAKVILGDTIDLGGMEVTEATTIDSNLDVSNGKFSGAVTISDNVTLKATNVEFTQTLTVMSNTTLRNCTLDQNLVIASDTLNRIREVIVDGCYLDNLSIAGTTESGVTTTVDNLQIVNNHIDGNVTKSGNWATSMGEYVISGNIAPNATTFDNTMRAMRVVNKTLTNFTDFTISSSYITYLKLKVSDLVWNFGETYNTVKYGFNAVQTTHFAYKDYEGERAYDGSEVSSSSYYWTSDRMSCYHNDHKEWMDTIVFATSSQNNLDTIVCGTHHIDDYTQGTISITYHVTPVNKS